jgi:hypothetical protein
MANLIQATVVNVGGNPQPIALSQAFLTSGIIMQEATVASSPDAVTRITYFSGPFANIIYYVSETVADLITAANTGTTSMIAVTVYEKNFDSFPAPISFGFPASAVVLQEKVVDSINTLVTCAGVIYSVSETLADIVTAANVGGGGGGVTSVFTRTGDVVADAADYGSFYIALTGTSTATGNMTLALAAANNLLITTNTYPAGLFFIDNANGRIGIGDVDGAVNSNSLTVRDGDNQIKVVLGATGTFIAGADYSANYTDRSYVDKAWVVAQIAAAGGIGGSTGATDNAVLRADGAGGATLQNSLVTISDTGQLSTPFLQINDNGPETLIYNNTSVTGNTVGINITTDNGAGANGGYIRLFSGGQGLEVNPNAGVSTRLDVVYGSNHGYIVMGSTFNIYSNTAQKTQLGASGTIDFVTIDTTGNVGIGTAITTPSARVHIAAGTATASTAPLKFNAGTLLTTPELGAFEYVDDGTTGHLYFTYKVSTVTTRREFTLI